MPVQQITVAPVKEVDTEGETSPRTTDQNEGKTISGCTGRRSSNRSKTSKKITEFITTSRTSISPPPQEGCSSERAGLLDEDVSKSKKHVKQTRSSVMTVTSTSVSAASRTQKKLVKRRRQRKRSSCKDLDCVVTISRQEKMDNSLSSDRSDRKGTRECSFKIRRELPPRLRRAGAALSESSSENEGWCEPRSWSKEKARRAHWRNGKNEAYRSKEENKTDVMELQSLGSVDETENNPLEDDLRGVEEHHSSQGSLSSDDQIEKKEDAEKKRKKLCRSRCSSQTEAEEPKMYQGQAVEAGEMSVPCPPINNVVSGAAPQYCSYDSELEVCRICHCEGDDECPLITPCHCTGSLSFVHQACLNQWIKSSDTRCCELCKFDFIMETKLKPFRKWEKLHMTKNERRKIYCSVLFHLVAISCMFWSVYILVKRTTEEIRLGRNEELWRLSLLKYYSQEVVLEWPFWTKLIMVSLGLTGGVVFMYIQCKVYLQLWRRLKAFNRIITVKNCPDKNLHQPQSQRSEALPSHRKTTETPVPAPQTLVDSDSSVEAAVAPAQNPV